MKTNMKNYISRKLTQALVLLAQKLDSINFLNLSWTKLSNQPSLLSRLQDDLKRESSKPLVEVRYGEEDHEEEKYKTGYRGVPKGDDVWTHEDLEDAVDEAVPEGKGEKNMYQLHKKLGMPFKWIPSCAGFKVELDGWDWIFQLFGREVRNRSQQVEIVNWRNGRANRHLFMMYLRLGTLRDRGDMKGYWKLGWQLMRSRSYQVSAFNYVYQNWSRNMSLNQSLRILEATGVLCRTKADNISFHRTYIPKNAEKELCAGNARPLGVPSPEWRVYLHMLNNLIVWARRGKEGTQHAYSPGRGVITAWRDVITNLPKWDYVYEFDLKGYFDNVSHTGIINRLKAEGWSETELRFFGTIMKSIPKLRSEDLLPEPDREVKLVPSGHLNVNWQKGKPLVRVELDEDGSWKGMSVVWDESFLRSIPEPKYEEYEETIKRHKYSCRGDSLGCKNPKGSICSECHRIEVGEEVVKRKRQIESAESLHIQNHPVMKYLTPSGMDNLTAEAMKELEESCIIQLSTKALHHDSIKEKGVPQGAAISCSLSNVASTHLTNGLIFLERGEVKLLIVMYADDGIVFSNSSLIEEYMNQPDLIPGVSLNKEKSRWLKFNGVWRVDNFKFLGLRYFVPKRFRPERIEASTRKGATLRLTWRDLLLHWLLVGRDRLLKVALQRERQREEGATYLTDEEEIKFGGSASHLNTRIPETLRDWVWQEYYSFLSYPRKLQLLFRTRWSGYFLSGLYLNSWDFSPSQDFSLKAVKGSWCEVRWAGYRFENWARLWSGDDPIRNGLGKLLTDVGKSLLEVELELKEIVEEAERRRTTQIEEDYVWVGREWVEKAKRLLPSLSRSGRQLYRMGMDQRGGSQIKLNIWNASSFGCDDLLRNEPRLSSHWSEAKEIKERGAGKGGLDPDWKPYIKYYNSGRVKGNKTRPRERSATARTLTKAKALIQGNLGVKLEANFQEALLLPFLIYGWLQGVAEEWAIRKIEGIRLPSIWYLLWLTLLSLLDLLGGILIVIVICYYLPDGILSNPDWQAEAEISLRPYAESVKPPNVEQNGSQSTDWGRLVLWGALLGSIAVVLVWSWHLYGPSLPPGGNQGWETLTGEIDRLWTRITELEVDLSRFKRSSSSYQHDLEGSYARIKELEKLCSSTGHRLVEVSESLRLECKSSRIASKFHDHIELYRTKVSMLESQIALQQFEIEKLTTLYELTGGTLD